MHLDCFLWRIEKKRFRLIQNDIGYLSWIGCSNYSFSADGFTALTASLCGAPLSARSNVDLMRKLAFRYRRIRDIYAAGSTNVAGNI